MLPRDDTVLGKSKDSYLTLYVRLMFYTQKTIQLFKLLTIICLITGYFKMIKWNSVEINDEKLGKDKRRFSSGSIPMVY